MQKICRILPCFLNQPRKNRVFYAKKLLKLICVFLQNRKERGLSTGQGAEKVSKFSSETA